MTPWTLFLNFLHLQQNQVKPPQGAQSILLSLPHTGCSPFNIQDQVNHLYQQLMHQLCHYPNSSINAANDMMVLDADKEDAFLQELTKRQWQQPQILASHFCFILGPEAPSSLLQQRLLKALEEIHSPLCFLWLGILPSQLLPTVRSRTLIWRLHADCLAHLRSKIAPNHGQETLTTDRIMLLASDREKRQQLMATPYTKWPELIKAWNATEKDLLRLFFDVGHERFRSFQAWEKWQEFQQWYQQSLEWNNGSKERHFFLQQIFSYSP